MSVVMIILRSTTSPLWLHDQQSGKRASIIHVNSDKPDYIESRGISGEASVDGPLAWDMPAVCKWTKVEMSPPLLMLATALPREPRRLIPRLQPQLILALRYILYVHYLLSTPSCLSTFLISRTTQRLLKYNN